ncbi:MAG: YesL family protein [Clostridiales bacterium]|nr:YesL family protein [Clostridiales bacterium]
MKLYEKLYEEENQLSEERTSLKVFFRIIQQHYLNLIGLNLLFLVCCLPVITIGPALKGLTRVTMNMVRNEPVHIRHDFFREFKNQFILSLGIGGLINILFVLLTLSIQFYVLKSVVIYNVFAGILICLFIYIIITYMYLLNETVYLDLSFKNRLKNAFLLVLATPKNLLIIILTVLLPFYLSIKSMAMGIPYLFIGYFSISSVIGSILSFETLNKYITKDSR